MKDFLGRRIADKRMLRHVMRFPITGILEDGSFKATEEGTPQGGNISQILANIYLQYALDLWFTRRFIKSCEGRARRIRYADDFVVCFQRRYDAEQFRTELDTRLGKFGLEVAVEKTKILGFDPLAALRAKARGEKPRTLEFLGLTHFCSKKRNGGRFRMKRKTPRN